MCVPIPSDSKGLATEADMRFDNDKDFSIITTFR